jgi:hypothetical protein
MEQDVGGGEAAQAVPNHLVDEAVIDCGALKAHAADEADRLHVYSPGMIREG